METSEEVMVFYADKARGALTANPSLRLLRHPHALFILSFLYTAFKAEEEIALPGDLATGRLAQFLETPPLPLEEVPLLKGNPMQKAASLLDNWCRDEVRILRRWADDDGQVWVELSPSTERAFQWIESESDALVGTESRYSEILRRLDEILDHAKPDPRAYLKRLETRKAALEREIDFIRSSGEVRVYSDSQIEERFKALNRLSRELLGDFRQVEQNFKAIVREIYSRQEDDENTRGAILSYTLDATEALRQSPQGQSFYSFWEHLIQDSGEEGLLGKVEELWSLLDDRQISHRDEVLRHLKTNLHQAGRKVIATNHLLAEKLNRLLTEKEKKKREKTAGLIKDIKDLAIRFRDQAGQQVSLVKVEGNPDVTMIMERPLADPPRKEAFSAVPKRSQESLSTLELQELISPFIVDTALLKSRLEELVRREGKADLRRVLEAFPLEKGLSEILAYISLASADPNAQIDPAQRWDLAVGDGERILETPQVTFNHE